MGDRAVVIAHHLVWTAYGTWLPNDPRGSMSRVVKSPALAELGEPHYGRKRVQPGRDAVREFYRESAEKLAFPIVRFDEAARALIGEALGVVMRDAPYTCYACAVMPDHVHLVIRKHRHGAEEMIERLQEATRRRLIESNAVAAAHPVWTEGGWKSFLDSPTVVRQRVRYVENNPVKDGLARQTWGFVTAYDGWPFREGKGG